MKKIFLAFTAMIAILLSPSLVFAQQDVRFDPQSTPPNQIGGCSGQASGSTLCTEINSTTNPLFGPDGILTKVANIFSLITGIIAVFMLIISGLRYVNSSGDPAKTASARSGIIYAAVGVAVAVVAQSVVRFVLTKL